MVLANINVAIKLNNQGVSLLERCSFPEAMSAFQQSIAYMKVAADEFSVQSCVANDNPPMKGIKATDWSVSGPLHQACFQHLHISDCGENNDAVGTFAYDRAFRLSEYFIVRTEAELSFLGAVVLANYGIAWQSKGRYVMDGNETCEKRAFHLYQLTLNMLEQSAIQEISEASQLSLVIFNNMASLHHENCNYEQAQVCLNAVSSLLAAIDIAFLNDNEVEQMSMNVALLVPPVVARAA